MRGLNYLGAPERQREHAEVDPKLILEEVLLIKKAPQVLFREKETTYLKKPDCRR